MCQIIFSGSGMTSHMCPAAAEKKIDNLLISVNQKGCSTGETLLSAYKKLSAIIAKKKDQTEMGTDIVIADGHKSRFNGKVMDHSENNFLDQFIIPPDTSQKVTQKHDQINQLLHSEYKITKAEMYSEYSINKEREYLG